MEAHLVLFTKTSGITLRRFEACDCDTLFKLIDSNREHLSQRNDQTAQKYPDLQSVLASVTNPSNPAKLRFGIWRGDCLVGTVNLTPLSQKKAEIGYWVGREYNGQGFATTATLALVHYAFEKLGFRRIVATVNPENLASQAVLKRAGFTVGNQNVKILFVCKASP